MIRIARRFASSNNYYGQYAGSTGSDSPSELQQITDKPGEAPATGNFNDMVQSSKPSAYQLGDYSSTALTNFFRNGGVNLPSDVIREKVAEEDYEFFLNQSNFLKAASSIQRYQEEMVAPNSEESRHIHVFKKNLYELYEVRHRSVDEHKHFSMVVDRRSLT